MEERCRCGRAAFVLSLFTALTTVLLVGLAFERRGDAVLRKLFAAKFVNARHSLGAAVFQNTSEDAAASKGPYIVFGIFSSPLPQYRQRLKSCLDTWAQDLRPSELLIVGADPPQGQAHIATWDSAKNCSGDHGVGVACKEALLIVRAWEMKADWLIILGDDNYMFVDNIRAALAEYDPAFPQILGIPGCSTKRCWGMCGGGTETISRAGLDRFLANGPESFIKHHADWAMNKCEGWSDQTTSAIAKEVGIQFKSLPGLHGWRLEGKALTKEVRKTDPKPLTLHYVLPSEMYRIRDGNLPRRLREINDRERLESIRRMERGEF